jgi:sterol desaturase/sphingolipid hydroxylase (fatty acid hydroxylase superfamily)
VAYRQVDGKLGSSESLAARIARSGIDRLAALSQTKANAQMGLACDVSMGLSLAAFGKLKYGSGAALPLAAFLTGLLFFTFVEYAFHRWLFHGVIGAFRHGHSEHHLHPDNDGALPFFAPPTAMLAFAMLLTLFVRIDVAALFVGGVACGYACYGLGHTVIHRHRFALAWPRDWAARHHIHHNHPGKNFGVTTPLWDVLLGTRYTRRGSSDAPRAGERKDES